MTPDWNEIVRLHGPLVWRTAFRILNEHAASADCCQEVFLEAWRRAARGPIVDLPAFLRWLAVRRALDATRRRAEARRLGGVNSAPLDSAVVDESPASGAALNELVDRLTAALARLPERQADAFWLRAVEEASYAEIASALDTSVNDVGVLIHRAREALRRELASFHPLSAHEEPRA